MDEGTIRMRAQLNALVADMYSVNTRIVAMIAANDARDKADQAPAYSENDFIAMAEKHDIIAQRMREEI